MDNLLFRKFQRNRGLLFLNLLLLLLLCRVLLTERAEAEAALQTQHHALQEAKERADQAMQITQMGLWTWDIRTGTLYADAMLARLFGYEPANLQATPIQQWRERTEPQDLPTLDDRLRACLKGERLQFRSTSAYATDRATGSGASGADG